MKKRILVGTLGILLIIATVFTVVTIRGAFIPSSIHPSPSLSAKSKHSPTPCQGLCQGYLLVQSHGPGTITPSPTPTSTPIPPPTPTPISITPTGIGNGGQGTSQEIQLAQLLFNQINSDRATQGLPPYAWNSILAGGAYQHNIVMTTTGCGLLHQCPNEPTPCQRFKSEGITLPACAENIDYSYISSYPDAWTAVKTHTEEGMLAEQPPNDGHRKNLLSSSLVEIGISILIDSQDRAWVTEDMTGAYP
jgi:uncharacterized protein YkwD